MHSHCNNCSNCSCSTVDEDSIKLLSISELKELASTLETKVIAEKDNKRHFINSVKKLAAVYKALDS